jgi:hypothetical protein
MRNIAAKSRNRLREHSRAAHEADRLDDPAAGDLVHGDDDHRSTALYKGS